MINLQINIPSYCIIGEKYIPGCWPIKTILDFQVNNTSFANSKKDIKWAIKNPFIGSNKNSGGVLNIHEHHFFLFIFQSWSSKGLINFAFVFWFLLEITHHRYHCIISRSVYQTPVSSTNDYVAPNDCF